MGVSAKIKIVERSVLLYDDFALEMDDSKQEASYNLIFQFIAICGERRKATKGDVNETKGSCNECKCGN